MHFSNLFLFGFVLSPPVSAATNTHSHLADHVHEKRDRVHPGWQVVSRAAPEAVIPVRIGLRQGNLEEGIRLFEDMTNFTSPNYGQWWTPEKITDFFTPSQDDYDKVHTWLVHAGISSSRISRSANKQWIQFDAPVSELETLLNTEYHEYKHTQDGHIIPACDQYHVPKHLSKLIDYIKPGVSLRRPSRRHARPRTLKGGSLRRRQAWPYFYNSTLSCAGWVTSAWISAMYNITEGRTATPGNELGLFQSPLFPYSQTDLDLFFKRFYPTIPMGTHPIENDINGAPKSNLPIEKVFNPEANADMQIAYPILWPQNLIMFESGDSYYTSSLDRFSRYFDGLMDDILYAIDGSYCHDDFFGGQFDTETPSYPDSHPGGYNGERQCGVFKAPSVFSTSYGDDEPSVSVNFSLRECFEWMKLGMQGTSVLVASGDNDVDCSKNDNRIFSPDYIASCPYVTAVGATIITPGSSVRSQQIATTDFASGGGFSNVFVRSFYQELAVEEYLIRNPPPFNSYSTQLNQSVGLAAEYTIELGGHSLM